MLIFGHPVLKNIWVVIDGMIAIADQVTRLLNQPSVCGITLLDKNLCKKSLSTTYSTGNQDFKMWVQDYIKKKKKDVWDKIYFRHPPCIKCTMEQNVLFNNECCILVNV